MGWSRTLLLGHIGNRMDIEDIESTVKIMRGKLSRSANRDLSQDNKIAVLETENAELKLYITAIVRLLTSKGTITPEELGKIVEAIDADDESSDDKYDGDIV